MKITAEGRDELRSAKKAGTEAARDAIDWDKNSLWTGYLDENVSTLLRENHGKKWKKKELLRIAKDILIDLNREMDPPRSIGLAHGWSDDYYEKRTGLKPWDVRQAWTDAAHKVLLAKNTIAWLADELAFLLDQGK